MSHLVLLGDSVFDNARYVPGQPPVIEQLRACPLSNANATLMAVDGAATGDVRRQLRRIPQDTSHVFISAGGNDALGYSHVLKDLLDSGAWLLPQLAEIQGQFQQTYGEMLRQVIELGKATTLCTIYDSVLALEPAAIAALSVFNDVILRAAFSAGVPVIDLRLVCTEASDYSTLSPIEPSEAGGWKIANAIATVFAEHDFHHKRTVVYV